MSLFIFSASVTRQFNENEEEIIALFKDDDDAWIFIQGLHDLDEMNGFVTFTGDKAFEREGIAVSSQKEDGGGYVAILEGNAGTVTYRLRLS